MIAGRYRLVRELGRGGSGVVHLAHDELLGRDVAVKQLGLSPGGTHPDTERAAREAKLSAALSHPSIVAVYDLVEHDSCDWLVMELVEGTTLSESIRSGELSTEQGAALLAQVADALAVSHAAGIVHRDVKPSNIFVTSDGRAKLGDFGIARGASDAALTRTGLVTGSPAYLAPEVISGASATGASDVWSLGATLFHALAGRPPYEIGDNLVGGLLAVVQQDPPRLDSVPAHLQDVLAGTMAKDPAARWTAAQVAAALRGSQPARPAPAAAPMPVEPTTTMPVAVDTTRPPRRIAAMALAVASLLVLGVIAWVVWPEDAPDSEPRGSVGQEQTPGTSDSTGSDTPATTIDPAQVSADMEAFVGDYLTTAATDPRAAFTLLTPEFQEASGGLEGYLGWWNQVKSAEMLNFQGDPEALDVSYTVKYVMRTGKKRTERISLRLVRHDDHYLIDGNG